MIKLLRYSLEKLFLWSPTTTDSECTPILKTLKNLRKKQRTWETKELKQVFPINPIKSSWKVLCFDKLSCTFLHLDELPIVFAFVLWVLWNTSKSSFNVTLFVTSFKTASSFSLKHSPSLHVSSCISIVPNEDTVIHTLSYCFNYSTTSIATLGFFVALSALLASFFLLVSNFTKMFWGLITQRSKGGSTATVSSLCVGTDHQVLNEQLLSAFERSDVTGCWPAYTSFIYTMNFGLKSLQ